MIACPNCGVQNREQANFCKNCAYLLVATCPRCGVALPADARYCDNCAYPLIPTTRMIDEPAGVAANAGEIAATGTGAVDEKPARADTATPVLHKFLTRELAAKMRAARQGGAMIGERKVVTILFCDVKGSTAAAETLDPEEWTEIINGAFEHMIRPVYLYEGTVARLMGDAILAFFGAPIAHEDDPYRAVRAGLDIVTGIERYREDIQRQWGIDFNVRVGINTGLVVVGAVGSDLRMEYTAMGDAINVAARMEQSAAPGTVQIAADTYSIVADLFEIEALGAVSVKGKQAPVAAYRVQGRSLTKRHHWGRLEIQAELTGRDEELAGLSRAVETLRQGVGGIVLLLGAAGMGKSRLLQEVRRRSVEGRDVPGELPLVWLETGTLSFESAQPYTLFRRLIRRAYGLIESSPATLVQERVAPLAESFAAEEQPEIYALFAALLDLDELAGQPALEGERFQKALFDLTPALFHGQLGGQRTVIVCEDLHWCDPASVALLEHWMAQTELLPLLLICVMRPVRQAPGWRIRAAAESQYPHRTTELNLQPLSDEESNHLVDSLIGSSTKMPAAWRRHILESTGGNPYFIEEVVRALIEQGAVTAAENAHGEMRWQFAHENGGQIHIPASLRALLTARIDNLPEDVRRTLQLAAVIGRTFSKSVLVAIYGGDRGLEEQLRTLMRKEMIRETARLPETIYGFRSPLIQEAAYDAILHRERRTYHLQVAEAMESQHPEQSTGLRLQLAHHYREANQHDLAAYHFIAAGDGAMRLFAHAEAIVHYESALALTEEEEELILDERLTHLYRQLGRALELDGQFAAALARYGEMETLARKRGEREMELAALVLRGQVYGMPSPEYDIKKGEALSHKALGIAEELGDQVMQAKINWNLLNLLRFTEEMDQARVYGERSLDIARRYDLKEQMAYALNDLAHIRGSQGDVAQSISLSMEATELWRELGNLPMLADSLSTAASGNTYLGQYDRAVALSEEALALSRRIKNVWGLSYSQFVVGIVYWDRGRPDRAISAMEACIRHAQDAGFMVAIISAQSDLATVLGQLGDLAKALDTAQRALKYAQEHMPQLHPYVLSSLTRLHHMAGATFEAEAAYRLATRRRPKHLDLLPSYPDIAKCYMLLHEGENEKAIALADSLVAELVRYGMMAFVPEARYLQGRAYVAAGEETIGRERLLEAKRVAEELGSRWMLWQILTVLGQFATESEGAQLLYERAHDIVMDIADHVDQPALRESFLARPDVRRLQSLAHPA